MSSVQSFVPNVKYHDYDEYFVLVYPFLDSPPEFEDPKLNSKILQIVIYNRLTLFSKVPDTIMIFYLIFWYFHFT